ncbi:MAG TPA: type II toxin-antitoxin system HipA family toxin [Burkholderiaceae bacterium]|nr:type II toxin-antitoxin system HipA family toxin [Burkholderiaceae bacterium]
MRQLNVWMNGERVGLWSVGRTGQHTFSYADGWREHPKSRPLSLSLPLTADGQLSGPAVENYFDNLLPDNELIRRRLSGRFKTRGVDPFSLLQAIGRDCVGAVQLLPVTAPAPDVRRVDGDLLRTEQIEAMLAGLGSSVGLGAMDGDDDFRISIAGAQEKTALLKVGDQWYRPRDATPTTHILKPPIGVTPGRNLDLTLSAENEWLCARILTSLGLPVADCHVERFGSSKALVVKRFDRQWQRDPDWLVRMPQEDLCQVLGQASVNKYEDAGGPGMDACLRVLAGGTRYEADGRIFLLAQLAFWLLAAIDGHAKNFSVFLLPGGRYHLTPLYDVMSAWPIIGAGPNAIQYKKARLAMAVRSQSAHYKLSEILPRHWKAVAARSGIASMWEAMCTMVEEVPAALGRVANELPHDFPPVLADTVFDGVRRHAQAFMAQI